MAASSPYVPTNTITGKVVEKETSTGIANVVVVIYDFDPGGRPEEEIPGAHQPGATLAPPVNANRPNLGDRLGSVLTSNDGSFVLNYSEPEFRRQSPDEQRPDLLLMVQAPEDADSLQEPSMLFVSKALRQNSGRIESYFIRIPKKTLNDAGIYPSQSGLEVSKSKVDRYTEKKDAEQEYENGIAGYHKTKVEQAAADKKLFAERVRKSLATDTSIQRDHLKGTFLQPGELVKDKVTDIFTRGIDTVNTQLQSSTRGVPVNLYLGEEDMEQLQSYFASASNGFATIPESLIRPILYRASNSENIGTLLAQNPIEKFNRETTTEEQDALKILKSPPPPPNPNNGTTGPNNSTIPNGSNGPEVSLLAPFSDLDLKIQLAKLLTDMPSPDNVQQPGKIPSRPSIETIASSLENFSLKKGPADVAAYYDFNSLQIAFDHVWQQLFDEELINSSYYVNQKIQQQTGVNPNAGDKFAVANFNAILTASFTTFLTQVPANVTAHFDITREEWNDLEKSSQDKLMQIAKSLDDSLIPNLDPQGQGFHVTYDAFTKAKYFEKLVEQGERIIDSVRHDNYYSMHKTLRDLHQRLNSAYEYTVFASDNNDYSVNFGVLNTYRQQWLPLNYQVGKLCSTKPLAPKEESEYHLKIKRHSKRSDKEARKNNSTMTGEQTSLYRVEADIVAKAQNKTSFNHSGDGTYNIGIAKMDAKTSFGIDAQEESAQTRKDFRESILKSTQEYKDERTIEITTDASTDIESTESGKIFNPNDSMAVTYLFYELQRRYRISEQLYRVMPVVLVAQPVPQPHEITEAWVIANDWILNRFLLDDSFRATLIYLANKSVGDDFALRELRRNLREQRNLVQSLKSEFAAASSEADNKYRALLNKISARLDASSDANGEGFFTNVVASFGYNDADPETARARELAANDEHRYAVEKAEKISVSLKQEITNLHTLTAEYNKALKDHLDNETRVSRLLVHFRNNILYYMQAIWSLEPPDQRFLRLQKVQVPDLVLDGEKTYKVEVANSMDVFAMFRPDGTTKHKATVSGKLKKPFTYKSLVEVAEIDQPLGFKGNYIIFPMKQHNALTDFMAAPFIDAAFGAMDPDQWTNINLDDFSKYIKNLHDTDPEKFEKWKPALHDMLGQLLADPLRNGDEVIIPSGSLYIEALPATHPLLEDFKLRHRELDVYKVQEEVRKLGLENLRYASRLIHNERTDPEIEKYISIDGKDNPQIGINEN
ncbi:hypothetical protein [Flavihumibacter solisilvae]|uniref:Uncharacterized protein n=1 Tax=Flavihumibacter solisilvae TaxID=1349421 RepID=A0A0C1L5V4_9BACT|nr:hypothetical protein [Flavihumibacter solisilvae]KIC95482.1 hypothetical protein OI18_06280 [Flavihumibacter solisilvae]